MVQFCQKCGSQLIEGDAFCEVCGAPVAQQSEEQYRQPYFGHQPDDRIYELPQNGYQQPQNGYQQPLQYPNNMYGQPPQPQKKKSPLLIVLIIVIAFVVLASGAFTVYWFALRDKGEPNIGSDEPSITGEIVETSPAEDLTDPPANDSDSNSGSEQSDTDADPGPDDFTWKEEDFNVPDGAEILKTPADVNGKWKAYIAYTDGSQEYAFLDIAASEKYAAVGWRITQIAYDGSDFKNGPVKIYPLEGAFDEGYINAVGEIRGDFTVHYFYRLDSKDYAYGTIINPSGLVGKVYMVK